MQVVWDGGLSASIRCTSACVGAGSESMLGFRCNSGAYLAMMRNILVGLLLALAAQAGCAAAAQERGGATAIQLGAAWYPEQWNEAAWEHDLALMEAAHFTVTRMGEFAWSRMEPSEGHYDLDWLARAVRLAEKHHIAVVIGTPTDAPPAWLTSKYPETLGTDANGKLREHGGRRQFSYSSPRYRQFCVAIATQLAKRFGHDANVIGWQIGNEYTDESFDAATRKQFQEFLKAKYKSLDSLNEHWATAYWSQTYSDWSQIMLPSGGGNPGLLLEHKHFVTATWKSFQHDQLAVIRQLSDKRQFITTNIGGLGWSDNWDHYAINEELDIASWDDYVGTGHLNVTRNAFMNDFVRGWKRKNFWVMETQPGTVNWAPVNNSLDPGETRALAWQTIGHGADAVLYWQWRDALNGQEQYHGAIVGPDGEPNPIYKEIQQLGEDLQKTSEALKGTTPVADVALLMDYDSRWAIDFQPHSRNYDQLDVLLRFYEAAKKVATAARSVDVVDPASAPLSSYRLVVAPSLNVISEALVAKLLAYVEQGGNLLLGPRSGMKDEFNALNIQRQPGPLAEALSAKVEQYYALESSVALTPDAGPHFFNAPSGKGDIWAESLDVMAHEENASGPGIRLTYRDPGGWLDGKPAMITQYIGKGTISYLGTIPDQALLVPLLREIALAPDGSPVGLSDFALVPQIEVCIRSRSGTGPDSEVYILINHANTATEAILPGIYRNLLPNNLAPSTAFPSAATQTRIPLPPQGVAVLIREASQ
jgi:beta-galactosidase